MLSNFFEFPLEDSSSSMVWEEEDLDSAAKKENLKNYYKLMEEGPELRYGEWERKVSELKALDKEPRPYELLFIIRDSNKLSGYEKQHLIKVLLWRKKFKDYYLTPKEGLNDSLFGLFLKTKKNLLNFYITLLEHGLPPKVDSSIKRTLWTTMLSDDMGAGKKIFKAMVRGKVSAENFLEFCHFWFAWPRFKVDVVLNYEFTERNLPYHLKKLSSLLKEMATIAILKLSAEFPAFPYTGPEERMIKNFVKEFNCFFFPSANYRLYQALTDDPLDYASRHKLSKRIADLDERCCANTIKP